MREFPEPLREAVLNNYLVNPSGLPGHWHELDLLQEHYNHSREMLTQPSLNDGPSATNRSWLNEEDVL